MANPKRTDETVVNIRLTPADAVKWHAVAKALGLNFEQLAKQSIDLVYQTRVRR